MAGVDEILPKTLMTMLNVLSIENGLRAWQIYDNNGGVSVKIHFGGNNMASEHTGPDSTVRKTEPFNSESAAHQCTPRI